jgi:hypothetical protein
MKNREYKETAVSVVKTEHHYITCPICQAEGSKGPGSFDHLLENVDKSKKPYEVAPRFCASCGAGFIIQVQTDHTVKTCHISNRIELWHLLRLFRPLDNGQTVHIVVKGNATVAVGDTFDVEESHPRWGSYYYIDEGTCPVNYLRVPIKLDDDADPHGIFQHQETIIAPEDSERFPRDRYGLGLNDDEECWKELFSTLREADEKEVEGEAVVGIDQFVSVTPDPKGLTPEEVVQGWSPPVTIRIQNVIDTPPNDGDTKPPYLYVPCQKYDLKFKDSTKDGEYTYRGGNSDALIFCRETDATIIVIDYKEIVKAEAVGSMWSAKIVVDPVKTFLAGENLLAEMIRNNEKALQKVLQQGIEEYQMQNPSEENLKDELQVDARYKLTFVKTGRPTATEGVYKYKGTNEKVGRMWFEPCFEMTFPAIFVLREQIESIERII